MTSHKRTGPAGRDGPGTRRVLCSLTASLACAATLASLTPPVTAMAAARMETHGRPEGWGLRAGFSSAPDQFVLGLHYDAGEPARRLRFMPNIDLGAGDHRTVVTINSDLVYSFPLEVPGAIYVGGACGVAWTNWNSSWFEAGGTSHPVRTRHTKTNLGVAGIFGYRSRWSGRTVFLDAKIRISDDYPGVKLMVGTNFGK